MKHKIPAPTIRRGIIILRSVAKLENFAGVKFCEEIIGVIWARSIKESVVHMRIEVNFAI